MLVKEVQQNFDQQKVENITPLKCKQIETILLKISIYFVLEKQRRIPNQKLSEIDMKDIHNDITGVGNVSIKEDLDDAKPIISKYCDYIEKGGAIKYTNFNFADMKLQGDIVDRFFALCGQDVTTLTIALPENHDYWYCDHPNKLCKVCVGPKVQVSGVCC